MDGDKGLDQSLLKQRKLVFTCRNKLWQLSKLFSIHYFINFTVIGNKTFECMLESKKIMTLEWFIRKWLENG